MNIKIREPREKSKSRKVNTYVSLYLKRDALIEASERARVEVTASRAKLTGSQLGEAERILDVS